MGTPARWKVARKSYVCWPWLVVAKNTSVEFEVGSNSAGLKLHYRRVNGITISAIEEKRKTEADTEDAERHGAMCAHF